MDHVIAKSCALSNPVGGGDHFCFTTALMNLEDILDDLSVRFLLALQYHDWEFSERLYFILEEAYWFFLDFYQRKNRSLYLPFRDFCERILVHNSLPFDEAEYRAFKVYKRRVPVYGGILLSPDMDQILLVKGINNHHFFFPKGKKCKDETGIECCCREVFEEVGLDIRGKVSNLVLETARGIFYFVFYVKVNQKFRTISRCEIACVKWVAIHEIVNADESSPYGVLKGYINEIKAVINSVKKNHFRFDTARIIERIDEKLKAKK